MIRLSLILIMIMIIMMSSCDKSVDLEPDLDNELHQNDLELTVDDFQWLLFQLLQE